MDKRMFSKSDLNNLDKKRQLFNKLEKKCRQMMTKINLVVAILFKNT